MSIDKVIESLPAMSADNREKLRSNAENLRDTGNQTQVSNAERVLQALIDTAAEEKQARYDELSAMSMAERVQDSFDSDPATKNEQRVITGIIDHPGLTPSALTSKCGLRSQSWRAYFAAMLKRREVVFWPDTPTNPMDVDGLMGLLIDVDEAESTLTMKPEMEATFRKLGFGTKKRIMAAS